MKSDTPSTECVGCGHEGHLWASGGVPWFWCLNDHCKYYIGTGPPHRIVVTGSSGAYRWYQAHINAIVRCLECDREYKPDDKRHYLTPESYRCPVCRIEYPVVKLIRRNKSKWSEEDMEDVANAVLGSGVLGMPHFRWFTSSYYNEATSDDPGPDADLLPKQKGFMRLLPDLFNVTTVQHKATVLAAIYAYYTDTYYPDSEVEQSFKDDMPMLWWPLWSYDVQHAYLIDKREYQTILSWVDEVSTACNPASPAPPAPTGTSEKTSKPKRAEAKEESRSDVIILEALKDHHKYEPPPGSRPEPTVGNYSPATLNDLAKRSRCSKPTISRYLKVQFGGFKAYCGICDTGDEIAQALMIRSGMPPKAVLRQRQLKRDPETHDPEPKD